MDGKGYIDPCDKDFDNHFERYNNGRICPQTEVGRYMFKQLKLGLRRHQLAWKYEQLELALNTLKDELKNFSGEPAIEKQLTDHYLKLSFEFLKYKDEFNETL